jgi:hypothetical protein
MNTDFSVGYGGIRLKRRTVINSHRFTSARTRTTTANETCSFATGLVMVVRGDNGAIACAKTFLRARSRFHRLDCPITRWRIRH